MDRHGERRLWLPCRVDADGGNGNNATPLNAAFHRDACRTVYDIQRDVALTRRALGGQ